MNKSFDSIKIVANMPDAFWFFFFFGIHSSSTDLYLSSKLFSLKFAVILDCLFVYVLPFFFFFRICGVCVQGYFFSLTIGTYDLFLLLIRSPFVASCQLLIVASLILFFLFSFLTSNTIIINILFFFLLF